MTHNFSTMHLSKAMAATLVALAAVWSASAQAQSYPTRPITVIVPVQPGATHDAFIRLISPKLGAALGQPIVVENRTGAGQSIGTLAASRAKPDGHTLLLASNAPFTVNPVVAKVGYDPVNDFEPIINIGHNSLVLVTGPNLPAKTLPALITLAKSKKGALLAASSGNGSTAHLALSQLNTLADVDITHVPYRGGPAAINDVVSGQVSMAFAGPTAVIPLVKQGRLQMLAYAGSKRSMFLPELRTMAEQGVTGFSVDVWFGLFAPKGTPKDIVRRLNAEIATLIKDPDIAKQMLVMGLEPGNSTPEELAAQIKSEIPVWRQMVMKAGVVAD
jgi:tripartite-type tricarboxylate transporter receptor subunit TctC